MPSTGRVNFTGSGEPEQIRGFLVTGNFFQTLGVTPLLGPGLAARDDQVFQPAVVVLSHGFWQRRFASDPTVVGREILLDGHPCRIVGVMPPGVEFQNPDMRRLVIEQGLRLTGTAIAVGTPMALLSARASTALLFEVQPYDPAIFSGMTATLACVALLASYIPARRASKIDPALLLRTE
jgi:ABC-type antimicrobial peptide transport system permease subunit